MIYGFTRENYELRNYVKSFEYLTINSTQYDNQNKIWTEMNTFL